MLIKSYRPLPVANQADLAVAKEVFDTAPAGIGEFLGATAGEALAHGPTNSAYNWLEMGDRTLFPQDNEEVLDIPTLNERYRHLGLTFDTPMPVSAAEFLAANKASELAREDIIARGGDGAGRSSAGFITALGASLLDPLNLAVLAVPGLGEANEARVLGMAGKSAVARFGARMVTGAAQGVAGMVALEPFNYLGADATQSDYGLDDTMHNLLTGAVFGGLLHAGIGVIGDNLTPATQREALSVAVSDTLQNQRTNAAELAKLDPSDPNAFANLEDLQRRAKAGEVKTERFGDIGEQEITVDDPSKLKFIWDDSAGKVDGAAPGSEGIREIDRMIASTEDSMRDARQFYESNGMELPKEIADAAEELAKFRAAATEAYKEAVPCVLGNLI